MEESKNTYYSNLSTKLLKQKSNPKTCWSVLKRFSNLKKIPCIPSLFHENKFVTGFREKAEFFYSFITKQCSLINSDSSLPSEKKEDWQCSIFYMIFYRRHINDNKQFRF